MLTTVQGQENVATVKGNIRQRNHHRAARDGAHQSKPIDQPANDPCYYGWRDGWETLPDGTRVYRAEPLTLANFLDPQEGDHFVQGDKHFDSANSLFNRYHKRYLDHPTIGVFSDLKIKWGIPGLSEPAPDLAVIPNLHTKAEYHGSFDVIAEGTRPCLVVEITSPRYQVDDTDKRAIYEQAGIQEYIILNPHYDDDDLPIELTGYRLVHGRYEPMLPDETGRILSETTGVWFALEGWEQELVLTDALTGERLLTAEEELAARLAAEARAVQAQAARLAAERLAEQEQAARLAAERLAEQEQAARLAAERLAEQEQATRLAAERLAEQERHAREDEQTARLAAEQRAAQEQQARLSAEAQALAMAAELAHYKALLANHSDQ